MNCLKCGREVISGQVFCEECLLDMEKHPVSPDTPVVLPRRSYSPAVKKPQKKRTVPLEEQIHSLRKKVRHLTIFLVLLLILLVLLAYPAFSYLKEDHFALGQNYSSITSSPTPVETASVATEP